MRYLASLLPVSFGVFLLTAVLILSLVRQKSVDGAWLLFISGRDGSDEIYRMWQDGSHIQQLTDDPAGWKMHVAASPDGRQMVFASNQDDPNNEIYRANSSGGGIRRLTNNPGFDVQPSWSPDGKSVLFYGEWAGKTGLFQMPIAADQTSLEPILRFANYAWKAEWSPDGKWLTFMLPPRNNFNIYLRNLDDSRLISLTTSPAYDGFATWSPDGQWVAFTSDRETGHFHIYRMRLTAACFVQDGCDTFSPPQRLTPPDIEDGFFDPQWSPDGEWIAFWGGGSYGQYQIYRVRSDGSDLQALTPPGTDLAPTWQRLVDYPWRPLLLVGFSLISSGAGILVYRQGKWFVPFRES